MRKTALLFILLTACLFPARAQFYLTGDDPARLQWYQIETPHYRVIFPQGADSLARTYGRSLEQFRVPLGVSLGGMTPGEGRRNARGAAHALRLFQRIGGLGPQPL